jgi:hypothetical protein
MYKNEEEYENEAFEISKVKELKNRKYVKEDD